MRKAIFITLIAICSILMPVTTYAGEDNLPEPVQGEAPDWDYGQIQLKANVHKTIWDWEESVFVQVKNQETGYSEVFFLEYLNNYEKLAKIPTGNYIILDGGLSNDYVGEYPVSEHSFTVGEDGITEVEFNVGDINEASHLDELKDKYNATENEDSKLKTDIEEKIIVKQEEEVEKRQPSDKQEEKNEGIGSLILNLIYQNRITIVIVLVLGSVLLFRHIRNRYQ